jgi:hypothetical protein
MKSVSRSLQWLGLGATGVLGALSTGLFLGGSSRFFLSHLGKAADRFTSFYDFLVVTALAGAILAFVLYRTARAWEQSTRESPSIPTRRPIPRALIIFQILCSLVVIARSTSNIGVPLDWDEHEHLSVLSGPQAWESINPLRGSENHALASLSAFVSMKIFGVNKYAARLPAVLYALAFLTLLNMVALRYLSTTGSAIYFLSLTGNGFLLYMMHSMRGYIPMMFFTLYVFSKALAFANDKIPGQRRDLSLFTLAAGAALFSHTFGGLFLVLLFVSLLLWTYQHRTVLSRQSHEYAFSLMTILLGWLALYGVISLYILLHLQDTGFAMPKDGVPAWLSHLATFRLFTIFGFVRIWEIRLFGFALGLLIANRLYRPGKEISFPSLFALVVVVTIAGLLKLLDVPLLEGRMLTPFLVLFFFWIAESLDRVPQTRLRNAGAAALILLFTLPFAAHHDDDDGVPGQFADHEKFSEAVHARLDRSATPKTDRCFSYSGDPAGVKYARGFYFVDENHAESDETCKVHFHLFFGRGLFEARYTFTPPPHVRIESLYDDGKGRVWFRIYDRPVNPSRIARNSRHAP